MGSRNDLPTPKRGSVPYRYDGGGDPLPPDGERSYTVDPRPIGTPAWSVPEAFADLVIEREQVTTWVNDARARGYRDEDTVAIVRHLVTSKHFHFPSAALDTMNVLLFGTTDPEV